MRADRNQVAVLLAGGAADGDAFDAACTAALAALDLDGSLSAGVSESLLFTPDDLLTAHSQALHAARCAAADPALPRHAAWRDLGIYTELGSASGEPVLAPLEQAPKFVELIETLERYLDNGCDAQRTAKELMVHRATLYYRLGRIATILGVDLSNGLTRSQLHFAVKKRRLAAAFEQGADQLTR